MGGFIRYLIAIGGNAITGERLLSGLSKEVGRLSRQGHEVVLTHGNGPQVGELLLEEGRNLALLTAQTEAETGLQIQKNLELHGRIRKSAIVITRARVDPNGSEFRNPTKPVGRFYSKGEAAAARRNGHAVRKLIGGYRIVVPSPRPIEILELGQISTLLREGYVVVAGGGGGVAVSISKGRIRYLDAVLDKDYTSSLLAAKLHADRFAILTNVDYVYTNFGRKNQQRITKASAGEMERYMERGEFEAGSMLPKVRACIDFIRSGGKHAVIGGLDNAGAVLSGASGSVISGNNG